MTAPDTCAHTWRDGWGEHTCRGRDDHDGKCRCVCDAETWRAT